MNTKREIQFRVWDTKNLEFSNFTNRDPHFDVSNGKLFFWEKTRKEDGSYDGDIILEDLGDRFILQQFTGLKDSKGNKVWEGDVVKIIYEGTVAEVYFDYNLCSFRLKDINGKSYPLITYRFDESSNPIGLINVVDEVVGNIFELPCNPDHNGECLVCDEPLDGCPFLNKENKD